jgi:hypothetical protein
LIDIIPFASPAPFGENLDSKQIERKAEGGQGRTEENRGEQRVDGGKRWMDRRWMRQRWLTGLTQFYKPFK